MNILVIGDIVGKIGFDFVKRHLADFKKEKNIDFVIANGENVANNGITREYANGLNLAGVDVITLGNHTFDKKDAIDVLLNKKYVIRPSNYPDGAVGSGSGIYKAGDKNIAVVNLMGRVNLLNIDCPFKAADRELRAIGKKADIVIVDFHAEATSEKIAMGYYLDGRATAVFGTHTHVQTADEVVLPAGTAYITDIGMTGSFSGVIGVKKEVILKRFITQLPQKFEASEGKVAMCGAIFEIDSNNKCTNIERVKLI